MRLNTGGTVSGQAMNAGRPRQSRTSPVRHALALAGLFLLAACGGSETDRETERPPRPPIPPACRRAGPAFPASLPSGTVSLLRRRRRRKPRRRDRPRYPAGRRQRRRCRSRHVFRHGRHPAVGREPRRLGRLHRPRRQDQGRRSLRLSAGRRAGRGRRPAFHRCQSGVRAITLMHVRHGQLRWEATVAPAERLARFGVPVSRALVARPAGRRRRCSAQQRGAPHLRRRGTAEGSTLTQPELAGTLGAIRQRGGVDFFQGQLARTDVRADLADGRQPAGRDAARRRAAGRRAGRRELRHAPASLCRAAAGRRRLGAGRLERPGAERPDADRFRRLRRPRRGRRQGRRGRLQPVDGPALRCARRRARRRRAAGRADRPMPARSAR